MMSSPSFLISRRPFEVAAIKLKIERNVPYPNGIRTSEFCDYVIVMFAWRLQSRRFVHQTRTDGATQAIENICNLDEMILYCKIIPKINSSTLK